MILSVDVGGMSTKIAVFKNKKIIQKNIINYPELIEAEDLFCKITKKIKELKLNSKISKICFSSPGIINRETGEITGLSAIHNLNLMNYKKYFQPIFNCDIFVSNDAKCAALAELNEGNAINVKNCLLIIIGTGLGCSIIINNKVYYGSNNIAGEIGCGLVNYDNDLKNYSQVTSMYNLENQYYKISKIKKSSKTLFEEYYKDDLACKIINKFLNNIANLILNANFIIDPELVLIGGAVSQNEFFIELLDKKLQELVIKSGINVKWKIKSCKYYNDSNLIGACYIK